MKTPIAIHAQIVVLELGGVRLLVGADSPAELEKAFAELKTMKGAPDLDRSQFVAIIAQDRLPRFSVTTIRSAARNARSILPKEESP